MNTKLNNIKKALANMHFDVVEVTKTNYTLDNGDVYEHQFEFDDDITVEEFQKLLDIAKHTVIETLNNLEIDTL